MMTKPVGVLALLSLLVGGCLDSLSVGLSASAVVDAGNDEPDANVDEQPDSEGDAGDAAEASSDASVADKSDASERDASALETCSPAYCAPAGLIMDKLCDGGEKICLRDEPGLCSWHCL